MTTSQHPLPTWLHSDRAIARTVARPLARLLRHEVTGGLLLIVSALVALGWANSPWRASYESLWHTDVSFRVGSHVLGGDLHHWVNDALMSLFFLVVGLEIRHEWSAGALRDRRAALLPAVAALGGMVVPAVAYVAVVAGDPGGATRGWGIPMATDIAFAVGVLAIAGSRVPPGLKLFLLTLAIVDDIGAIAVIALVYTDKVRMPWLIAAAVLTVVLVALRRLRIWYSPVHIVAGVALWLCVYESGVHATIAGVVLGLVTPAQPLVESPSDGSLVQRFARPELSAHEVQQISVMARESVAVGERWRHALEPWTRYVVVPLFALANAGIELRAEPLRDGSLVLLGVLAGLLLGKPLGVMLGAWIAVRLLGSSLPAGTTWRQLAAAGVVAGIGFTVSLFIADLGLVDDTMRTDAKTAVLLASAAAAIVGLTMLRRGTTVTDAEPARAPTVATSPGPGRTHRVGPTTTT